MKNVTAEYPSTAVWGGLMLEQLDIHKGEMSDEKTIQKQRSRLMRKARQKETAMN